MAVEVDKPGTDDKAGSIYSGQVGLRRCRAFITKPRDFAFGDKQVSNPIYSLAGIEDMSTAYQ
jgi:hypothetical protein